MDVRKSNTKAAVLFLVIAAIPIVGIVRAIVAFVHEGRRERDRRMSDVLGLPYDEGRETIVLDCNAAITMFVDTSF